MYLSVLVRLLGYAAGAGLVCPNTAGQSQPQGWERIPSKFDAAEHGRSAPCPAASAGDESEEDAQVATQLKEAEEKRRHIFRKCALPGTAALTFDEGPSAHTHDLLDILSHHKVKAGFHIDPFRIASGDAGVVERMAKEGHVVGLAVVKKLKALDREAAEEAINEAYDEFLRALKIRPRTVRLPRSGYLLRDVRIAEKMGLFVTEPSLDSEDVENPNFLQHLEREISSADPSKDSVILVQRDRFGNSVRQVGKIIDLLESRGFRVVSYEEACRGKEVAQQHLNRAESRRGSGKPPGSGEEGVMRAMVASDEGEDENVERNGALGLSIPFIVPLLAMALLFK